jgi:hypothetical protein
MDRYIGTKLIEAEPAVRKCGRLYKSADPVPGSMLLAEEGYRVRYEDGYESWSPKAVFEKTYLKVKSNPKTPTVGPSISQEMVDDFIANVNIDTLGKKTTVVAVTLVNGFEIIETSSCVDPANYSMAMGAEICLGKIKDRIWAYLGFLLQTGISGIKPVETEV